MKYIHIYIFIFFNILLSENQGVIKEMDSMISTYEYKNAASIGEDWLKNNPDDVEVIWRLAQCNFYIGQQSEDIKIHKKYYYPALEYARKALELNPKSARANHWYAVLIGQTGIIEGTEQKIINSYESKKYADIAISLDPNYDGTYHVLGRWNFELADLSWIERSIASWVYATPPQGSFEEAVEFFKKAVETKDDEIRHYVWLGNSYFELGDYQNARTSWEDAFKLEPKSELDELLIKEAKNNLAKLK